jgi:hypothetical protein
MRFEDHFVSQLKLFTVGQDTETGRKFISFPVSNGLVEYEEYYFLDDDKYDRLKAAFAVVDEFVARCKNHQEDERLIMEPGSKRGLPVDWPPVQE